MTPTSPGPGSPTGQPSSGTSRTPDHEREEVRGPTVPGPPVVYLPLRSAPGQDRSGEVALARAPDGTVVLLGYSALDRLIDACGADRPWMLADAAALQALRDQHPWDLQLLDVPVPPEHRERLFATEGTARDE